MEKIVVVGGGIVGTMHAWAAIRRGFDVVHLEADEEPQGATVRNFGLLHVSVREPGPELTLALRSRRIWTELGAQAPDIGLRPIGSLLVLTSDAEMELAAAVLRRSDAEERELAIVDPAGVRALNPALAGSFLGALHSRIDAVVEPARCLPAIRRFLATSGRYHFVPGAIIDAVTTGAVVDHRGRRFAGDHVVLCPGSDQLGVVPSILADTSLETVHLQMQETEPLPALVATAVVGGDVMRTYPAFDLPERLRLPPPDPLSRRYGSHLIVTQRTDGGLTVGDTHVTGPVLPYAIDEPPLAQLMARLEGILGRPLPQVRRRWTGRYARAPGGAPCLRTVVDDRVTLVTGLGGRGMTLAPAVAEDTLAEIGGAGA